MMMNKTTFPKAKLARLKVSGAEFIAYSLMTEICRQSGEFKTYQAAVKAADHKVDSMTTRQLYSFLKDNGYSFDIKCAAWRSPDWSLQS